MKHHQSLTLSALLLILICPVFLFAQPMTGGQIDSLVKKSLQVFDVPGMAVAVISDGKLIHSKGYGVRSIHGNATVNEHTLFAIASNTKAFTAAALGLLVTEGKLKWDDRVIDYIPEFRMYDSYVTSEFTVRDLLTHRSGLGLGAGDLMIFPDGNNYKVQDVIHAMRYLQPVSGFRTKYDYDNQLYIIAGEVVARVSGKSYEAFVEERIMQPLEMKESHVGFDRLTDTSNIIDAHAVIEKKLISIDRYDLALTNAAGGIYSNIHDLSKWLMMLMNQGKYGKGSDTGKVLIQESMIRQLWSPQTIVPVGDKGIFNTHFSAYGLGWFLSDVKGYKKVTHTGGLPGMVTQITMIPELKLGIIVLTNQQNGSAFSSVTNTILQSWFGMKPMDWIGHYKTIDTENERKAATIIEKTNDNIKKKMLSAVKVDADKYLGTYRDQWFGEVTIETNNNRLLFTSKRSPKLSGEMLYYAGNTFVVRWTDRSMEADAFATFSLDQEGNATAIKMVAISPLTDFSYDFHDLELRRVTATGGSSQK